MTGELFEVKDDKLSVVSLDGHRISIRHIELKDHYDPFKVVVPGKTLQEIVKREVAYKISTYGKILTNSSPASHTSESGAFS